MTELTMRSMSQTEYAEVNVKAGNWRAEESLELSKKASEQLLPEGKDCPRLLLHAAEEETLKHGVGILGLNVFGTNHVARKLYEFSGYSIV